MDCPFCEEKNIKPKTIYKNKLVFAFPTNIPITPGHTLICPVRHISKIDDLTVNEFKAINALIIKIKNSLIKSFGAEGFNIAWNEGISAGQSVSHLHIHIVPRRAGDKGVYKYDPREFLYRPGSREITPKEELISVAKNIKKYLS
ncbi:MAG: HIT family protein [Candidatus Staskawiczbacteria bacterium]|nr:HIT family protein [Candidatus Staskawiczbacteria bacterium]